MKNCTKKGVGSFFRFFAFYVRSLAPLERYDPINIRLFFKCVVDQTINNGREHLLFCYLSIGYKMKRLQQLFLQTKETPKNPHTHTHTTLNLTYLYFKHKQSELIKFITTSSTEKKHNYFLNNMVLVNLIFLLYKIRNTQKRPKNFLHPHAKNKKRVLRP